MDVVALLNGKLVDINADLISMEDRGYQFGDGVYEVVHVYNGKCFALEGHLERLERSLHELRIPVPYTQAELKDFHNVLIKESGFSKAGIYTQITRGTAPRAHNFPAADTKPCLTMSIREAKDIKDMVNSGIKSMLVPDIRWLRCDIKSLNLLGNVLAKQQAKENGCFEAIQHRDGIVTEGSSSNFFVVKEGKLWTHPANNYILNGITRTVIAQKLAPKLGLTLIEQTFGTSFINEAEEAFISGTMSEIIPVVEIDGKAIGNGSVGEVTRKLQNAFYQLIEQECK